MSFPAEVRPLAEVARQHFGTPPVEIKEMPGGASLRRFFRVRSNSGSAIGMFFPDAAGSEEVGTASPTRQEWPFIEVQRSLQQAGVRVPKLYATDKANGWLLLEDLGETTLAQWLELHPGDRETLYQHAVADLAEAQCSLGKLQDGSLIGSRSFDQALLEWELEHFWEWGLSARGLKLRPAQRLRYTELASQLASRIGVMEYGFVHRDYQSRNLMVQQSVAGKPQLWWVDFQDALLGPRVYDLVALLSDSYQSFSADFVDQRLQEYCQHRGIPQQLAAIRQEFALVTVQRKLKDAGRFVYIQHKKGDSSYLRFIEPSLNKVAIALRSLGSDPLATGILELLTELGVLPEH